MIAFALAAILATGGFQGLYDLSVEALPHLVRARPIQTELGLNAHVNQVARVTGVLDMMRVVFKQFRSNRQNAAQQFIQACSLGNEAGDVIARGNPNAHLIVPLGNDEKLFHGGSLSYAEFKHEYIVRTRRPHKGGNAAALHVL